MTMLTIQVTDVLKDRILIGRESARLLEGPLATLLAGAPGAATSTRPISVTIDFRGIEGMAPSFVDELLLVFDSLIEAKTPGPGQSLIVANPPTRLSLKFEAIARGHQMSIQPLPDGSWRLTKNRDTGV